MTTQEFLNLLSENQDKELLFEYAKGAFIDKSYHITEVKNVSFDSVDCGGNEHSEEQTVVQLWTNPLEFKNRYMASGKALSILERVHSIKPLTMDSEIFFEYGDRKHPTSNYSIKSVNADEDKVVLKMYVQPTICKPAQVQLFRSADGACCGGVKCC